MTTPYSPSPGRDPVQWVMGHYPGPLVNVLTDYHGGLPADVRQIITDQLRQGVRTPERLADRVEQRWFLRYSRLTRDELRRRADEIAIALVAPSDCTDPDCEDGLLLTGSRTCRLCLPARSEINMRAEDVPDGRRSTPAAVNGAASAIRAQLRQRNGFPRDRRPRPGAPLPTKARSTYVPAPYTLREPELPPDDDQVTQAPPRYTLRESETLRPTGRPSSPHPES
ncbi:hypothetical protein [Kitasatospora sp. NPDC088134]|uniref:hypothetical protein n=1 Tax=Kitasatospora sp. NPDC088134 TaxID=3364071 RepID=UPI00380BA566